MSGIRLGCGNEAPAMLLIWDTGPALMKFAIVVVRADKGGREEVLHQTTIDEISPKRAKAKAEQLISAWRGRGAAAAQVLNQHGEEIYRAT